MAISQDQIEKGARVLYTCLESALAEKKGCLIGRNGSTELTILFYTNTQRICTTQMAENLERYSGIFPATQQSLLQWIDTYTHTLESIDKEPIVAGWFQGLAPYEEKLLQTTCPDAPHIPLRSLEPYYVKPEMRWTNLLAGKRVAVVSSFATTIQSQLPKANDIWGEQAESLLPSSATWIPIQTGFPPSIAKGRCAWPGNCKDWQTTLAFLVSQVVEAKPEICLVGCGALGMMLGSVLKAHGIATVVMGGAIQVLFGIKGQRWQTHSVISTFWNDAWAWPLEKETPGGNKKIEGGCYWNPSTN